MSVKLISDLCTSGLVPLQSPRAHGRSPIYIIIRESYINDIVLWVLPRPSRVCFCRRLGDDRYHVNLDVRDDHIGNRAGVDFAIVQRVIEDLLEDIVFT